MARDGVDADRQAVRGLAGAREPVELLDEVADPGPERLDLGLVEEGFAAVRAKGEGARDRWADEVAAGVPAGVVWAGISLGVMAARTLVGSTDDAELFTYPGDVHLFTDASLPTSDPAATAHVLERILHLLGRVDGASA